jgi:hypothetical protein
MSTHKAVPDTHGHLFTGTDRPPSLSHGAQRSGTMSTVGSEKHSRIRPGMWRLLIHGNCPRCSHRHAAATIRFRVSTDPSEATPIQCERCEHRWLTIGGRNKTETSLLSTKTVDPDVDEVSFRHALFSFVRSTTALDSVPERSLQKPSRRNSTRSDFKEPSRPGSSVHKEEPNHTVIPGQGHDTTAVNPTRQRESTRHELFSNNVKLTKVLIRDLKRKLRRHFPILDKVHLTKASKSITSDTAITGKESASSAVSPLEHFAATARDNPPPEAAKPTLDGDNVLPPCHKAGDCRPEKSLAQAITDFHAFDKQVLKAMTRDERVAWIREKVTAFKGCSRYCTCRRRRSSSPMVDSSTQVHLLPPDDCEKCYVQPRRQSLVGIGSHFDQFLPGEFLDDHTLTISATRTSEADTIVESNTINSSRRSSTVDFAQRQRHRSWSPRPPSSISQRQPMQQRAQHQLMAQVSMDSIITGGAGRSTYSATYGRDRRSRASLPPPVIASRSESPVPLREEQVADEVPSNPSVPLFNSHFTNDEQDTTSESASPSNTPP